LKSVKALGDAYCLQAEELGGAEIVVKPIADHYSLARCTAGAGKSELENRRIRFFEALLCGGEANRDEWH
jgi:hypothetical protein